MYIYFLEDEDKIFGENWCPAFAHNESACIDLFFNVVPRYRPFLNSLPFSSVCALEVMNRSFRYLQFQNGLKHQKFVRRNFHIFQRNVYFSCGLKADPHPPVPFAYFFVDSFPRRQLIKKKVDQSNSTRFFLQLRSSW